MNYPQSGNGWRPMPHPNMPPQPYPGQAHAPGYYPLPPPPKKKKTWLWVLLAILAVIVLAIGSGIAFVALKSREQNRGVTVTYEVTGTGTAALVVYSYNRDGATEPTEVALPWTKQFTGKSHSSFSLQAKALADDTVTCKVSIGGKVIATDTQPSYYWSRWLGQGFRPLNLLGQR
jgi:hypothetical protein